MSLIVIPKKRASGRAISGWLFDVTTEESIDMSADIAKDPVEDGRSVSDHRTRKPKKLRFKGIKTATTIRQNEAIPARLEDSFAQLEEIFNRDERIEVVSTFGTFANMAIASIQGTISASKGLIHTFTIALEELFVARAEEVIVAALVPKKKRLSALEADEIRKVHDAWLADQTAQLSASATTQEQVKSRALGENRAVTQLERDDATQKALDDYLGGSASDDEKDVVKTLFARDPDTAKFLGGR